LRQNGSSGIGRDDHPNSAHADSAFEFVCGSLRLDQRNRAEPGKAIRIVGAPFGQRIVQRPMPGDTCVCGKAVTENIRPGTDDLQVDALLIQPGAPLLDRFDQARKEWADLEPTIER
jgi:hypothetical protein